jgi:Carboxypeptidase regulatory-like domain/TonB-dependent Receptor Plug Domain
MRRWFQLTLFLLSALSHDLVVAAQNRTTAADLSGIVLDQTGAALEGARVTAVNVETNLERIGITGRDGGYLVPALPPGTYIVTVGLTQFATQVRQNVVLTLGSTVSLDFTLVLASLSEQITVAASAPRVDPNGTAVGSIVSKEQIENLPINGRNFISFSVLTPGVTTDRTPQQGAAATSGLTFAGQRARSNNIMVDGVDNTDETLGAVRATFSQEAVREFQVLTNSYSAEFGKATGGVVNIVTKSGTNTTGGDAFFFFRDESLNAKNHFEEFSPAGERIDGQKAPFSLKQFGGTLGGPLKKDRSFYFISFERLAVDANNLVNIDDRTPLSLFGRPIGTAADVLRGAGFPIETGNVPYAVGSTLLLVKLDQQLRSAHNLSIRFNRAAEINDNIEPWGGLVARSRGASRKNTDMMLAASYTAVVSPRAVNELRSQIAYRDQLVFSLDPNCEGRCDHVDEGGPTLEVIGVANVGRQRFTPQPRRTIRYQALDTVTFYGERHHVKAGFDFSFIQGLRGALPLHFGGRYIFGQLPAIPGFLPAPISSIQALALGLPSAYVQGYGNPEKTYPYKDLSLFGEDAWRVRQNLTLKLGVRYQNQFWPDTAYNVPGLGTYGFPSDTNNVAPRLAVAWEPLKDKRTVVHGAYGIFYDNTLTSLLGISSVVDGGAHVRTLVLQFPSSVAAWRAPGHRLLETAVGQFPSLVIAIDPRLKTPHANHIAVGFDRELRDGLVIATNFVHTRGFNQPGTIDYNPLVPTLGAGRRPGDRNGQPGTSASVLQYTSFGETWYRGLTLSLTKRPAGRSQFAASYTLSKAEDNVTDFASDFIPQDNGRGRDPNNPNGLPLGFNPEAERGPSVQDQRHRFVFSGSQVIAAGIQLASIVTVASGRPYNVLAGQDLNNDGDGGVFPSDRARRVPADPASSVGRNSGLLPAQATVDLRIARRFRLPGGASLDAMLEAFNLFSRTNFTEINNIFGAGAYPTNPLVTFGQFEKAAPPFQGQLAIKVHF